MAIPPRGRTSQSTYFVSTSCWEKKNLLQSDRACQLLLDVLSHYRSLANYLLHEFVIMPDHFHLLLTPIPPTTLEKAVQLIKGGFSYRAKKELQISGEIWQTSFHDRRVRNTSEYDEFKGYIWNNPVVAGLVQAPEQFRFSSASSHFALDHLPQRLKPVINATTMQG
jgi:putative transposase